jgi:putative DNA primase/helicase
VWAPSSHTTAQGEAEQVLGLLWPEDGNDDAFGGHFNVWTLEGRRSLWFPCRRRADAAAAAERLAGKANVYCGTALIDLEARKQQERIENNGVVDLKKIRGTNATARAIPGLWADVDVGGPMHGKAHKNTKLPPTYEDARALIAEAIPLEPTVIIDSGHGLYFWWLFAEPSSLDTEQDREEAAELVYRFQATLRKRAEAHGWEIDGTADLARVLRLPGTINHKLDPVPVRIIALDPTRRYQTDSFDRYLVDVEYRNVIS